MVGTDDEDDDRSSLDLSLRLRRGSCGSRDSFYLDLDKGIDSDIDLEPTRSLSPRATSCSGESADSSHAHRHHPEWVGLQSNNSLQSMSTHNPKLLPENKKVPIILPLSSSGTCPGPIYPKRVLASPETLSASGCDSTKDARTCSTSAGERHTTSNGHVSRKRTLDVVDGGSIGSDDGVMSATDMIDQLSTDQSIFQPSGIKMDDTVVRLDEMLPLADGELEDDVFVKQKNSRRLSIKAQNLDSAVLVLSAMYAKLLIVLGVGFPVSEVISPYIPPSFFVGFYLYLYAGSIVFLVYAYSFLLHKTGGCFRKLMGKQIRRCSISSKVGTVPENMPMKRSRVQEAGVNCGSFYLRMGAVAFGIGSMIYSGLEFGQFFELDPNSTCYSVLIAITPCTQMAFTFFQLYFVFMNSKMCIYKYKNVARFGLMHMVATNMCVWLYVLVQESKHEILKFIDPHHGGHGHHVPSPSHKTPVVHQQELNATLASHGAVLHRVARGLQHSGSSFECRRVNIMGQLVQDVSPFLFPFTIEYSLICAAILYVMWKNIGRHQHKRLSSESSEISTQPSRRHHYSVDCAHANKGLFTGILVLVLAIISLILFFVLISNPDYKDLAVLEAHISELVLYCLCTIASVIALMQVRELRYSTHHYVELDNILLIVAQTGVYLFAIFCIIGGHFTMSRNTALVLLTALANLIQASVQTIFVLDASRRHASTADQLERKPGREMITFLLVCNFAMWAINSLETRRSDSNPVQLNFYGFWAWTIIAHISTPLAIFFRFHSTVCLCEIWKKLYKVKQEHV